MCGLSLRLDGRVALVTGGYGVLGGCLVDGLVAAGARVAVLGRRRDAAEEKAEAVRQASGEAIALTADVLAEPLIASALDQLIQAWQRVDILVNAAGGNVARAPSDNSSIFDVSHDAIEEVLRLNMYSCTTSLPVKACSRRGGRLWQIGMSSCSGY